MGGTTGTADCPPGYKVLQDLDKCQHLVPDWNSQSFWSASCYPQGLVGGGCFTTKGYTFFSTCSGSSTDTGFTPVCVKEEKIMGEIDALKDKIATLEDEIATLEDELR